MALLSRLNPVQQEAVQHTTGPLLIFAGAGSGKTRVLTYRIAYLIKEKNVSPSQILAVTFTNKAAEEMKARVQGLLGFSSLPVTLGTFHAVAVRILRKEASSIGLDPHFVIYDETDQRNLMKAVIQDLSLDEQKFPPKGILSAVSRAKNEMMTWERYKERLSGPYHDVVGRAYELYQKALKRHHALDFDDLLMNVVTLLKSKKEVLKRYQEKFKFLLVDEYQDVNRVQYLFVKLLAQHSRNICVVGDDDQSIYSFRGADPQFILDFQKDFPEARVIKLEQNYRSSGKILEAANHLVKNNTNRAAKDLWTDNSEGESLTLYAGFHERDEARFVIGTIKRYAREGRFEYGDFVILYRTNAQSRSFEEVLVQEGVPYKVVGGVRFYDRKEIKDLLAYLKVILNPQDSLSLKRILNVPARGIGKTTVGALTRAAEERGEPLSWIFSALDEVEGIRGRQKGALESLGRMLERWRGEINRSSLSVLLDMVMRESGILRELESENSADSWSRVENCHELVTVAREFERERETGKEREMEEKGDGPLEEFLSQVALLSDIDSLEEGPNAVTLMTLHAVKGLEFPVVFMGGMEEGLFPHSRSLQEDGEVEEERRLCYVGMTRAMELLFLTRARERTLFGSTATSTPSRFLEEIPGHLFRKNGEPEWGAGVSSSGMRDHSLQSDSVSKRVPGRFLVVEASRPSELVWQLPRVGEKVAHPVWGKGVVVSADGNLVIVFEKAGIKRLPFQEAHLLRGVAR